MPRTLDRARPYGETWGNGMVCLEQDNLRFNVAGDLLPDEPGEWVGSQAVRVTQEGVFVPEAEPEPELAPMSPADKRRATWAAKKAQAEAEAPVAVASSGDLTALADDSLKTLVDIAGGTWKDRDAAIAFLQDGAAH